MTTQVTFGQLCNEIGKRTKSCQPIIVGISGFGGAGKSTVAERLADTVNDAVVVSADDFTVNQQRQRGDDWPSIDRSRIAEQVLMPARNHEEIRYQQYDWPNNQLGEWRTVTVSGCVIVEGIGIIHPDLMTLFDMTVWIDVPLDIANARGKHRDREIYKVDHDALWDDLWTPNDRSYFERFRPDNMVDFLLTP